MKTKRSLAFDQLESKLSLSNLIPPTVNVVPVQSIIVVLDWGGSGNDDPPSSINGQPPIIWPSPIPVGPAGPALQIDYSDGLLLALDSGG